MDAQGQLRKKIKLWKDVLHAPVPRNDCIENGYRLCLKFVPPSRFQINHQLAKLHENFVNDAGKELLEKAAILEVQEKPYLCSPLSVMASTAGKLHLVLNLKYLNNYLHVIAWFQIRGLA